MGIVYFNFKENAMPFKVFGLSDPLVQGILATGYVAPTEIQTRVIPAAIEGKDVIGCAQTGTGKTAAFVLPILNRLGHEKHPGKRAIKSLILTPTRELAIQIEKCIHNYGRFLSIRSLTIFGGVKIQSQFKELHHGVDIVVATPGRLLDHINRRSVDLRHVEVLVLDEADRMLDMGFIADVKRIINLLPKNRQTMFFSATISPEIKELAEDILKSPLMVQIGKPRNPIETITQHIYPVTREQKFALLTHMLSSSQMYSVLVFTRTKLGADRLNKKLKAAGIDSVAIHSGRTQSQRMAAMDGFRMNKYQVMVATDIAARGIDISGITHVINYDVPTHEEDYIHRIGRTGRAEATGDAITFVCHEEDKFLRSIERFIGREFKDEFCKDFNYASPPQPQKKPQKDNGGSSLHRGKFPARGHAGGSSRRRRRGRR
jgi:ATP-dependent RNA helicase RhlE